MGKDSSNYSEKLSDRFLDFSVQIISLISLLPANTLGKQINYQLAKSGPSPGANYEEACGAKSKADFIHKLGIVLKELRETRYWLRVIKRPQLIKVSTVEPVLDECQQLCSIIGKSVLTSKQNK